MGLTTSSEAIGRHMTQIGADTVENQADPQLSPSDGIPAATAGQSSRSTSAASTISKDPEKRESEQGKHRQAFAQHEKPKRPKKRKANPPKNSSNKRAAPLKRDTREEGVEEAPEGAAKINPHRAKILVGKQALAAIKAGTRIYIKSGEGNGGDTWWDSGVIQKIHERGKPYEVEWEKINNRGEEVDTGVEKRIILPVTYSLAGVAAEALKEAATGTEAAALTMNRVLAEARIGSWCIRHPEEPWGMLDPFGTDSIPKVSMQNV